MCTNQGAQQMTERKGMNARRLSERTRQPGHDQTFVESEEKFITVAKKFLPSTKYGVTDHPDDLRHIFIDSAGSLGIVPEASITNLRTGRKFFVEVKKQGPQGNADERACKHHTIAFAKCLNNKYGYSYHPFVTIFCANLATDRRYTLKAQYFFEPDNYLLWRDYDEDLIATFLTKRCEAWLD
jgi:hypothetical protein